MRFRILLACACAALIVSPVLAHGPQIQITADSTAGGDKIVTRQLLPGNAYSTTNGLTAAASVYVMPSNPVTFLGNPVSRLQPLSTQTFGPGFTYGYDQFANPGGTRKFAADLTLVIGELKIWNGSTFVATGDEQLGVSPTSGNVNADAVSTVGGGTVNLPITIAKNTTTQLTNYGADSHSSVRYQLLGNGTSANESANASRDGVYLVSMLLAGTQASPSLASSDPFYYIVSKNVGFNDLVSVVNSFASSQGIASSLVQYVPTAVPEPGTVILAVTGSASFACGRKRLG
jgi:hypothetical protein